MSPTFPYLDPAIRISVANIVGMDIVGAVFLTLGTAAGTTSSKMVYLAEGVWEFYLSQEACKDLGIISHNFPCPQVCGGVEQLSFLLTGPYRHRNLGCLTKCTGGLDSQVTGSDS